MINLAIIGYGRAGKIHFGTLNSLENHHLFNIKYIVEPNEEVLDSIGTSTLTVSDIHKVINDPSLHAVIIASPTNTHEKLVKLCLHSNKHVFVEKPLCNSIESTREIYNLATKKSKLLFIGFNRRYDPQWVQLKEDLNNKIYGNPLHFIVICRDYPFPPKKYLETCGGIIRDCVVHDLDAICYIMNTKIKEIEAHVTENEENSYINLILENGTRGTLVHSRYSESYDQRVNVFCETGTLQIKNATFKNKISFSERYRESYINQMTDFLNKIFSKKLYLILN